MMALTVTFPIVFGGLENPLRAYVVVYNTYMVVMFGIAVRRMARRARNRRWRPGAAANAITRADVWLFAGGITVMAVAVTAVAVGGLPGRAAPLGLAIDTAVNVLVTIPVAARELTHVVRGLALAGGMVVATAAAYFGGRALVAPLRAEGATPAADVALIAVLVAVWVPAQAWLRRAVHRVVLGRREHLWNDLHAFLSTLSPDAGATACCRRALVELVRVLGLRGAAIVMRDGDTIVEGEFDAEPLRAAWPRGEALDALPRSSTRGRACRRMRSAGSSNRSSP
jgi:hypothetical protein